MIRNVVRHRHRTNLFPSPARLGLAVSLALGCLFLADADRLVAQATGTVAGTVVNAETAAPLNGVQVTIQGTQIGTLTGADGQYRIQDVPAGQQTVQVRLIGFARQSETVSVTAGETVTVDFQLEEQALLLDEIVVTGTPGQAQRRSIGNVVESVDATEVVESSSIENVQQLLSQRVPGMMQLPSAGQVGTGSPIRIRGLSSMSLENDPIVYIDGVRMSSDPRRGPNTRGGSRINRLNELNPEDIESVEVIKGPSAATLYGTEASNGVIQIITKRGASGEPRLNLRTRAGTNWMQNPEGRTPPRWRTNSETGELEGPFNIYEEELEAGHPPIFENGELGAVDASLSGGTEDLRYFTSAAWEKQSGIVGYDFHERLNARANLQISVSDDLTLNANTSFSRAQTRLAQNTGGFGAEPFSNIIWSFPSTYGTPQRGFMVAPPEEWAKVETMGNNDRTITSLQAQYQPMDWFTHRLSVGLDLNSEENSVLWPRQPEGASHLWGVNALGARDVERIQPTQFTMDYAGSAVYGLGSELELTTSAGFQYIKRVTEGIASEGNNFPAIPITTVSGGTDRDGSEQFTENATLGVYVQEELGWRNRVFLTGAVRLDDNSAFGSEFDAAVYPKLSGTWVIHEEPFFDVDWIDQFRFRSAWGAAGQQPGTFDAPRLFEPEIGFQDQPALVPSSFGNPELKPERSEELEAGFDLGLLDDRIEVQFTRYQRWIKDAIVQRPVPPSTGFSGSQIVNIGEVHGWGNELGVNARVVEDDGFDWDLGLQVSTNGNEIKELGGLEFVPAGTQQRNVVGYPIGAFFYRHVLSAEINEDGDVVQASCDGGTGPSGLDPGGDPVPCDDAPRLFADDATPTWTFGFNTTFTFFDNLRLNARVEGAGGHQVFNSEMRAAHNISITEDVLCRCDPMVQATRQFENNVMGMLEGGFLKLRELGVSYDVPTSLARRIGASEASVSLAGRNLMMLWTEAHGWDTFRDGRVMALNGLGGQWTWDPEMRSTGSVAADFQTVMPPLNSATLTVRLSF